MAISKIGSNSVDTLSSKLTLTAADGVEDNDYIMELTNAEATDGRSYGLRVKAGSTSADQSFVVQDHDASNTLLKVTGDGDVNVGIGDILFGTAGKGINLGVTSNTDSNTLDDYEEGTFTATFTCGTSGTITLDNNELCYTKIGRIVHVTGSVDVDSVSSPQGNIVVGTLPFTSINTTDLAGKSIGLINIQAADIAIDAYTILVSEGATTGIIYTATTAQPLSDSADQFGGNESAFISLTYVAA